MVIEFAGLEQKTLPTYHGGDGELLLKMINDGHVKIMEGVLTPGSSVGMHHHETNCEIIYVIKGSGKSECMGITEEFSAGKVHYCPKGQSHNLINNGSEDMIFLAIVPEQ